MKFEFECVYGSNHTPDTGYYYNGWYVVDGGTIINHTKQILLPELVIDVETIPDDDCITVAAPIYSLEELINQIENRL